MVIVDKILDWFADINKPALLKDKAKSGKVNWGVQILDPNPDDLIDAKGQGVRIYQDMLREPYVKAALNNKKYEILAWDWIIEPGSEEQRDIDIAAELEYDLTHIEGQTFNETLYAALDALDCGYSIQEILMKLDGMMYRFRKFRSLDTYYYKFNTDAFGNVLKVVSDSVTGMPGTEEFDPRLFFVYSHNQRYSNPYGSSDLRAAYRAFWIKDTAWKMRSIYMEKYGMPTLVGKVPTGSHSEIRDELLDVLRTVQTDSAIVIEEDQAIEVVKYAEAGIRGGQTEFESATKDLNKDILVGILGSFLAVEEGQRTGSRNMGQVHHDLLKRAAQFTSRTLEDAVNEQIVGLWVRLNFGELENPPVFKFDRSQDFDRMEEADVVVKLRKAGLDIAQQEIREKFGYREPEEGEDVLATAIAPNPFGGPAEDSDEDEDDMDDTELIAVRDRFWNRLEPLYLEIASACFDAVKKSGVVAEGDILKAGSMKLPVNVGKVKRALSDAQIYGNVIGRGGTVDFMADIDATLQQLGVSSAEFSDMIRNYTGRAEGLAGKLRDDMKRSFRRELMDIVANNGSERDVWAKFHEVVTKQYGLANYSDAVDIEALSAGYNDGLKTKYAG